MTDKYQIFNGFPAHENYIFVNWDRYAVGEGKDLIGTDSVASCLAITLYDPLIKKGLLAHITGWKRSPEELKPEKVIGTLLDELNGNNYTDHRRLEATLAGEGDLSEHERISPIVRAKLQAYGIPIIGEDLCRADGRFVFLHCDSGQVEVYRT